MRDHRPRKVDARISAEVNRHVEVHPLVGFDSARRRLTAQVATAHTYHVLGVIAHRCCNRHAARHQPFGEQLHLPTLRRAHMRAAKVQHRRGGCLAGLALEDIASVESAQVVREHPTRKVDVWVAGELKRHRAVHAHG